MTNKAIYFLGRTIADLSILASIDTVISKSKEASVYGFYSGLVGRPLQYFLKNSFQVNPKVNKHISFIFSTSMEFSLQTALAASLTNLTCPKTITYRDAIILSLVNISITKFLHWIFNNDKDGLPDNENATSPSFMETSPLIQRFHKKRSLNTEVDNIDNISSQTSPEEKNNEPSNIPEVYMPRTPRERAYTV